MSKRTLLLLAVALVAAAGLTIALLRVREDPTKERPDLDAVNAAWSEGVALMDQYEYADAERRFRRVLDAHKDYADAWFNLGVAIMNQAKMERYPEAFAAYKKALALAPDHHRAAYMHAWLLDFVGERDAAQKEFEALRASIPNDPDLNYKLGIMAMDQGDAEVAITYLKAALAAESHYSSAINTLQQALARAGKKEERAEVLALWRRFEEADSGRKHGKVYNNNGRYGQAVREFALRPKSEPGDATTVKPSWRRVGPERSLGAARREQMELPDGLSPAAFWSGPFARSFGRGAAMADLNGDGINDLWEADGKTLGRLHLSTPQGFVDSSAAFGLSEAAASVSGCFGDIDNDGDADLFVCCAGKNALLRNDGTHFTNVTESVGLDAQALFTSQAAFADLDNDADLDLYIANVVSLDDGSGFTRTTTGAANQFFVNLGSGTFVDQTNDSGVGGNGRTVAVLAADLDDDRDVDLFVMNDGETPLLYRNDRLGRFTAVELPEALRAPSRFSGAIAQDLDHDAWPELIVFRDARSPALVLRNVFGLTFVEDARWTAALSGIGAASGAVFDMENDGDIDLLVVGENGARIIPTARGVPGQAIDAPDLADNGIRAIIPTDLNQDGLLDLIVSSDGEPTGQFIATHKGQHWLALSLKGVREEGKTRANTGGVSALIEVMAKSDRQARQVITSGGVLAGYPACQHFGLGEHREADYVRIVWPDDVIQSEMMLAADQEKRVITQVQRKASSCPLLFTWDGERWQFVTDILGTGGSGFFLSPGQYARPDPSEWVKIPLVVERNGAVELRIHEPMEEILYLDQVSLLIIDHPKDLEVWPDERMPTDDTDPTGRLLVIRTDDRVFPTKLTTRQGPADPALLHVKDRRYQPGIEPDRRFLGYAVAQEITLDFGATITTEQGDPYLFVEGWVEYPYSHVNYAAWQAGLTPKPLSIDVELADGTWRPLHEDIGYPAGLPRMSTYPLASIPKNNTGRLRLRTNLELYLDQVFVAHDQKSANLEFRDMPPTKAVLRQSGYPREYSPDGNLPLLYDYALMDTNIDFKAMQGNYTRFGDVTELLREAEDHYVILGRAEEVTLSFGLPEPGTPGLTRSYVLKSFGYCKDMDLYTASPHTVEPLPHRAMETYPPPAGREYPDTRANRRYLETWNTRRVDGSRPR